MAQSPLPLDNWHTLMPSPIESVLAQGMMDPAKAGVASALMAGYGAERQGAISGYRQSLAQAQQLAMQQMQQQARQQAVQDFLKATEQGSKTPGLMDVYSTAGLTRDLFGGTSPDAYAATAQAVARAAGAQNLERAGKGTEDLLKGGVQPGIDYMRSILGSTDVNRVTPLALQQAAAHSAGGGGGVTFTTADPLTGSTIRGKATDVNAAGNAMAAARTALTQGRQSKLEQLKRINPTGYNFIMSKANGNVGVAERLAGEAIQRNPNLLQMAPVE